VSKNLSLYAIPITGKILLNSSIIGASILQGAHHDAKKFTANI